MIYNGEMCSAQPRAAVWMLLGWGGGILTGQSVQDPSLSNSREQAAECTVGLGSFEIKVQAAENGHYSASWRADMFLRTETVFMRLDTAWVEHWQQSPVGAEG